MTAPRSQDSKKEPDPVITISKEQADTLRQAFRNQFLNKNNNINHTDFNNKCIEAEICKTALTCKNSRKCNAFGSESRRMLIYGESVNFRKTSLETLCTILFKRPFSEWLESFASSLPVHTPDNRTNAHNTSVLLAPDEFSSGLIKIHRAGDYLKQVNTILNNAKNEIWFYNYSLELSLTVTAEQFLKALNRGVKINLLFLSPLSTQIPLLANILDTGEHITHTACENNIIRVLERLKDLRRLRINEEAYSRLKIRITNNIPHLGVYLYDPELADGRSFFLPSVNQMAMVTLPMYEFVNIPEGICSIYMEGVRKEWATSTPLHAFLETHHNYIENYYSSFFLDYPLNTESGVED